MKPQAQHGNPGRATIELIAEVSLCDPATVRRFFAGQVVRGASARRIERAMDEIRLLEGHRRVERAVARMRGRP